MITKFNDICGNATHCVYCGLQFTVFSKLRFRTIDHFIPISKGGRNTKLNRLCACSKCNSEKANAWPEQYSYLLSLKGNIDAATAVESLIKKIAPYRETLFKSGRYSAPKINAHTSKPKKLKEIKKYIESLPSDYKPGRVESADDFLYRAELLRTVKASLKEPEYNFHIID